MFKLQLVYLAIKTWKMIKNSSMSKFDLYIKSCSSYIMQITTNLINRTDLKKARKENPGIKPSCKKLSRQGIKKQVKIEHKNK